MGSVGGGGSVGGVGSVPMVLSESSVPVRVEGGDEELAIANKSELPNFHLYICSPFKVWSTVEPLIRPPLT